ncbi:MAG: phage replisome organizer N-terminal domain-containing protein [Ruminococcus sp.]|nr:phage replisome organizer N-terminal domain-containing protein [Ruminococcus sp.]
MTKRYYWIKLRTDFFDLETIDWLISQQNGCEYVVLYQKLCLLTANKGGELASALGEIIIPYDVNKIARDTKFSFDTVVVALELFKKIGLIYEQENGILKIPYVDDVVGSETEYAQKKRNYRLGLKTNGKKSSETLSSTLSDKSIETDKEIDTEIDIDSERETEKKADKSARSPSRISEIVDLYHKICTSYPEIMVVSDSSKKDLKTLMKRFSVEQIKKVFETAEKSDFLKGINNRDWKASFDWLIRESNFVKVLNGNYNNKQKRDNSDGFNAEDYDSLPDIFS